MMERTFDSRENRESRDGKRSKRDIIIKRDCKLCMDQIDIDYKQADLLKKFMTERGKILPRQIPAIAPSTNGNWPRRSNARGLCYSCARTESPLP